MKKSTLFHLNTFRPSPPGQTNRISTLQLPNALFSGGRSQRISLQLTAFKCQGQIKPDFSRASITIQILEGEKLNFLLDSKVNFENTQEFCKFLESKTSHLLKFIKSGDGFSAIPGENVENYYFSPSLCSVLGLRPGLQYSGKLANLEVDMFAQFREIAIVCNELETNCFCNQSQFGVMAFVKLKLGKAGKILESTIEATPENSTLQTIPNLSSLSFQLISLSSPEVILLLDQLKSFNLTFKLSENIA